MLTCTSCPRGSLGTVAPQRWPAPPLPPGAARTPAVPPCPLRETPRHRARCPARRTAGHVHTAVRAANTRSCSYLTLLQRAKYRSGLASLSGRRPRGGALWEAHPPAHACASPGPGRSLPCPPHHRRIPRRKPPALPAPPTLQRPGLGPSSVVNLRAALAGPAEAKAAGCGLMTECPGDRAGHGHAPFSVLREKARGGAKPLSPRKLQLCFFLQKMFSRCWILQKLGHSEENR